MPFFRGTRYSLLSAGAQWIAGVLNSAGTKFTVTRHVRNSSGTEFTVVTGVLNSSGDEYVVF